MVENRFTVCPACGQSDFLSICPNCGKEEKGRFCSACGTRMDSEEKKCPRCGATYFSKACPDCGYMAGSANQGSADYDDSYFDYEEGDGFGNSSESYSYGGGYGYNGSAYAGDLNGSVNSEYVSPKSKALALIFCVLFGCAGVHYFYAGRIGMGLVYLFTGGVFGIGWIYDMYRIVTDRFHDGRGKIIANW